jgi:holo-[acyl-carrier protein] synthase
MNLIGVDLVEIARLMRSAGRSSLFLKRTFTAEELEKASHLGADRRREYLAGRFAAKEALLKALRLGIEDVTKLLEIEVLSEPDGSPRLRMTGSVARIVAERGFLDCQVSISHDGGLAVAFVLLS